MWWNWKVVVLLAALAACYELAEGAVVPEKKQSSGIHIPVGDKDRKSEWYIQYNGSCDDDLPALFRNKRLEESTPPEKRDEKFFMEWKKNAAFVCLPKYYQQDPIVVTGFDCLDDKRCGCEDYQIIEVVNRLRTCRVKLGKVKGGACLEPFFPCVRGATCLPPDHFERSERECTLLNTSEGMTMTTSASIKMGVTKPSTPTTKMGGSKPLTPTTKMCKPKRSGGEKIHIVFQKSLPRWTVIFFVFMNVFLCDGSTAIFWSN